MAATAKDGAGAKTMENVEAGFATAVREEEALSVAVALAVALEVAIENELF